MTGRRRAQTTIDFAIGISVFLIVVAFVVAFVPTVFTPFEDVDRPERTFAGAESVALAPGETARVSVRLSEEAFRRYDPDGGWTVDAGQYGVEVGRSARDCRAETSLQR